MREGLKSLTQHYDRRRWMTDFTVGPMSTAALPCQQMQARDACRSCFRRWSSDLHARPPVYLPSELP
jgi:hypothetical protein